MLPIIVAIIMLCCDAAPVAEKEVSIKAFQGELDSSNLDLEFGEYFEGDMILTKEQKKAISTAVESRNGLIEGSKRWPNYTVIYDILEDDFEEEHMKMIQAAMADIANISCITFKAKEKDEHAVVIKGSQNGCYSNVGFNVNTPEQVLNLAKGCFRHGTVVHEMLHTLGFYHMQSTYNRDDFVQIIWDNISPGKEHNFAKYNNDTVTDFGVPYDYSSVMHYPEIAFSKNGNKTIIPLQDGAKIGQRKGMSESDIKKLNKMYCEMVKGDKRDKNM